MDAHIQKDALKMTEGLTGGAGASAGEKQGKSEEGGSGTLAAAGLETGEYRGDCRVVGGTGEDRDS